MAQLLGRNLDRLVGIGEIGRLGERDRNHERHSRGGDLAHALVLVARSHDHGLHPGLARDRGGAQHLEHLVRHEQRRARALHGRLKRLQGHVGLGPLLALRGARVGRLHLAVPACVEERLPNHRDRSHERARIALGRRLEGDHLHRVLLEHRGARAAVLEPGDGALPAQDAVAGHSLHRRESRGTQRLDLVLVERQRLGHVEFGVDRRQRVPRTLRFLGLRGLALEAAGALPLCPGCLGRRRDERVDQARIHGEAVAFPDARVGRNRHVRPHGNDDAVADHDRAAFDDLARPRHDPGADDGVHPGRGGP